jgi:RNA polymerase-binding transcription factor DksA
VDPEHPSTPRPDDDPPDLSILGTVEGELSDVERSLSRLDEGTYGTCQACGAPIDDERLAAEPATPFCREHAAS